MPQHGAFDDQAGQGNSWNELHPCGGGGHVHPAAVAQDQSGDNGKTYRARISKLNARVEGVSQSLELEARFDGPPQGLLPGMVGTVTFPGRPKN